MIDEAQTELLEILAQSSLGLAAIFFAILAILLAAYFTLLKESERLLLKHGLVATYCLTLVALLLAAVSLTAVRYQTVLAYQLTVGGALLMLVGIFGVATFMITRVRGH